MSLFVLAPVGQSGSDIIDGVISRPRVGAWTADLTVDATEPMTGAVDVQLGDGFALRGTVLRGGMAQGRFRVRVVGGGGGLEKLVGPRHYTTPSLRIVLADVLRDAGEQLSSSADAGILGQVLEHWTTQRMPAGLAIRTLMERAQDATVWRVLDDGSVWVGAEAWPDSGLDVTELHEDPVDGTVSMGLAVPYVPPGVLVGGRKVDMVQIAFGEGDVRATAWVAP